MLVRDRQRIRARAFSGGGGPIVFTAEYLLVAGGGGGGYDGAGGGAGGYRSSVTGEASGGGASAESSLSIALGTSYTVTVGAGGAGSTNTTVKGTSGTDTVFNTVTSAGGGGGASRDAIDGLTGGSGGGAGGIPGGSVGSGTANQGFAGGLAYNGGLASGYGGGGGAAQLGQNAAPSVGGDGGDGVESYITGSAVYRAGGGGGGHGDGSPPGGIGGTGGLGGGGNGSSLNVLATAGAANTGGAGGGGGRQGGYVNGAAGGSGAVIIRVPNTITATFTPGVTHTLHTPAGFNVYEITAAGASDTVTFNTGVVWTPAQLTGLALWLDAADSSTITLNGSDVSQWDDKSGNNHHVIQATSSFQPTYQPTGFVGKPTVYFDAINDLLACATTTVSSQGDLFYGAAFEMLSGTADWRIIVGTDTSENSSNGGTLLLQRMSTRSEVGVHDSGRKDTGSTYAVQVTDLFVPRIATAGRTGGTLGNGGTITITATGPSQPTYLTQATQTWSTDENTTRIQIGGRQQSGTGWSNSNISEVIVCNTDLSTTDRQKLEGYLAWKWGGI